MAIVAWMQHPTLRFLQHDMFEAAGRRAAAAAMIPAVRIQFLTQMWPGPDDPDLAGYLVPIHDELERQGHELALGEL